MSLEKRYQGYRSFSYLKAGEDYRAFEDEKSRVWVVDIDGPVLIAVSQVNERFDGFVDRGTEVVESIDFLD